MWLGWAQLGEQPGRHRRVGLTGSGVCAGAGGCEPGCCRHPGDL